MIHYLLTACSYAVLIECLDLISHNDGGHWDHLIAEFEERFSQLTQGAVLGLHLLPTKVNKLTPHDEAEIATYFKMIFPLLTN